MQINCKCGVTFNVDYSEGCDISGRGGKVYHEWNCKKCGQRYWLETSEPIILKNETGNPSANYLKNAYRPGEFR